MNLQYLLFTSENSLELLMGNDPARLNLTVSFATPTEHPRTLLCFAQLTEMSVYLP